MVSYDYPVVYDNDVMLTYYLGQYIVGGFIGKILGKSQTIGVWATTVYNAIGISLAFLIENIFKLLSRKTQKVRLVRTRDLLINSLFVLLLLSSVFTTCMDCVYVIKETNSLGGVGDSHCIAQKFSTLNGMAGNPDVRVGN